MEEEEEEEFESVSRGGYKTNVKAILRDAILRRAQQCLHINPLMQCQEKQPGDRM